MRAMDWLRKRGSGQARLWGGRAVGEETEKVAIKKWLRAGYSGSRIVAELIRAGSYFWLQLGS